MLPNTTRTLGAFKTELYQLLDMDTIGGVPVSHASGTAADIDKRLLSTAARCLRRVTLLFPLAQTAVSVTLSSAGTATLPEDCVGVLEVFAVDAHGRQKPFGFYVEDGVLHVKDAPALTVTAVLKRFPVIDETTPEDAILPLCDVTFDAWLYLTAMEVCPVDNSELYAKLTSAYNSLCYDRCRTKDKPLRVGNRLFARRARGLSPWAR